MILSTCSLFDSTLSSFDYSFFDWLSSSLLHPSSRSTATTINPSATTKCMCITSGGSSSSNILRECTRPISFPRIPYLRGKSCFRIYSKLFFSLRHNLRVITNSINRSCFYSVLSNPVIRRWCQYNSSLPETNQERCYTFSSSCQCLCNIFEF